MKKFNTLSREHDPYAALRYPEFRNLVLGNFLFTLALLAQEVALGYELYLITRNPLSLGLIGLIEAVPFISFSLFGGHIADKYSKRKILLRSVGWIIAGSVALQILVREQAHISQTTLLISIYVTIFIIGLCRAFLSPTANSLRAILVPVPLYENASAWGSTSWQVGAIAGPMIAGFSYAWVGFANTLLFVTLMVIASFIFFMQIGEKPVQSDLVQHDVISSIRQGIRFVFKTKIILYSISLDLFSVMFGGVMAILPIYAEDILHVGAQGLGILRASPSIGAVLTLLMLTRFSPMKHAWRNLLMAVTGFGVSILIFAVSPWMGLSVAMLFIGGAFDSVSVVIRATILQVMTPDEMRGRVLAVNGIFLASSNELGAFESGVAARLMGTVPSAVFGGVMTLLIVTWVYFRTGELKHVEVKKGL
ncbi:MAG: MFS transporter [Ignavibacteriae bacterium]|nr:MAG: MFS transporter [Ignavibacteriota bacterium]